MGRQNSVKKLFSKRCPASPGWDIDNLRCQRVSSVHDSGGKQNVDAVVFSFVVSVFFAALAVVPTLAAVKPLPSLLEI